MTVMLAMPSNQSRPRVPTDSELLDGLAKSESRDTNCSTDVKESSDESERLSAECQPVTQVFPAKTLEKAHTTKTTFTLGSPLSKLQLVRTFTKFRRRRVDQYTIDFLERSVYDNRYHVGSELLAIEGLVSVDGDEEVPPYLVRCFMDRLAFVHGLLIILIVVCSGISSPFTFSRAGTWSNPGDVPLGSSLLYFDFAMDILYGFCMVAFCNISFMHQERRVEVVSRGKILEQQLLSPLFWTRTLGATTYIWLMAFDGPLVVNNFKIVRLLHLLRWPDSLWWLKDSLVVRLVLPIALLINASHWVACLLSCIGGYHETLDDMGSAYFGTSFQGNEVSAAVSMYLMAFVEALYMLTGSLDNPLGEGDSARNKSFGALVIVTVCGPIGCVITALLIAAILREHSLKFALDMRHEENKEFIQHALQTLNIPQTLQRRVFSLQYYQKMSHDNEAFSELFNKKNLSPPLESALRIYLYHDSVLHSQYFKDKDHNYILEVIRVLEDQIFIPGDFVTRLGEVDCKMFFVAKGLLKVLVPNAQAGPDVMQALVVGTKSKGDYFGEIALIKDCVRTAWVRSDTYVLVSTLERIKIEAIWKYYPEEREHLMDMVAKVALADRKRQAAQLKELQRPASPPRATILTGATPHMAAEPGSADAAGGGETGEAKRVHLQVPHHTETETSRVKNILTARRVSNVLHQAAKEVGSPPRVASPASQQKYSPWDDSLSPQFRHKQSAREDAMAPKVHNGVTWSDRQQLCNSCGTHMPSESVFCSHCGARQNSRAHANDDADPADESKDLGTAPAPGATAAPNSTPLLECMVKLQRRMEEMIQRQSAMVTLNGRMEEMLLRQASLERLVADALTDGNCIAGGSSGSRKEVPLEPSPGKVRPVAASTHGVTSPRPVSPRVQFGSAAATPGGVRSTADKQAAANTLSPRPGSMRPTTPAQGSQVEAGIGSLNVSSVAREVRFANRRKPKKQGSGKTLDSGPGSPSDSVVATASAPPSGAGPREQQQQQQLRMNRAPSTGRNRGILPQVPADAATESNGTVGQTMVHEPADGDHGTDGMASQPFLQGRSPPRPALTIAVQSPRGQRSNVLLETDAVHAQPQHPSSSDRADPVAHRMLPGTQDGSDSDATVVGDAAWSSVDVETLSSDESPKHAWAPATAVAASAPTSMGSTVTVSKASTSSSSGQPAWRYDML